MDKHIWWCPEKLFYAHMREGFQFWHFLRLPVTLQHPPTPPNRTKSSCGRSGNSQGYYGLWLRGFPWDWWINWLAIYPTFPEAFHWWGTIPSDLISKSVLSTLQYTELVWESGLWSWWKDQDLSSPNHLSVVKIVEATSTSAGLIWPPNVFWRPDIPSRQSRPDLHSFRHQWFSAQWVGNSRGTCKGGDEWVFNLLSPIIMVWAATDIELGASSGPNPCLMDLVLGLSSLGSGSFWVGQSGRETELTILCISSGTSRASLLCTLLRKAASSRLRRVHSKTYNSKTHIYKKEERGKSEKQFLKWGKNENQVKLKIRMLAKIRPTWMGTLRTDFRLASDVPTEWLGPIKSWSTHPFTSHASSTYRWLLKCSHEKSLHAPVSHSPCIFLYMWIKGDPPKWDPRFPSSGGDKCPSHFHLPTWNI